MTDDQHWTLLQDSKTFPIFLRPVNHKLSKETLITGVVEAQLQDASTWVTEVLTSFVFYLCYIHTDVHASICALLVYTAIK